ncbi:MAG: nucleotidyltransferase [Caulobacterales bacterium 68-7]|nr:MAG: nucleotidyltransferase [Caulobacterales bacterium 68-7]
MKLVQHFTDFLTDVVNLNATRIDQLEDSVTALKTFVRDSSWEPRVRSFAGQGSWAHKTIIKPVEKKPFDADLLVYIDPKADWTAAQYVNTLYDVFAANGTYKDKVKAWSHCVTVTYAGERKIDIAPCLVDRDGVARLEVCNRDLDAFERSEPRLYTDWLIERNGWTGGNGLRKVTRLLKYLRDIKGNFTCPSVLLTTLLGLRITEADNTNTTDFADVPTALKTIVGRLDDWLQANTTRPTVLNPKLASETLSNAWDDVRYANFRSKIHTYRTWIDDAYDEADRDESIGKWRRVFGDDFAKSVTIERAAAVSTEAVVLAKSAGFAPQTFLGDLVNLFAQFGSRALPPGFDRLAHKQRPAWRVLQPPAFGVKVVATLHTQRTGGAWIDMVVPLPKHHWLKFDVRTPVGTPISADYEVYWRVTNTDRAAKDAGCLRGEILKSNDGSSHWEQLEFRGVHTVEAFIVRPRDQVLIAQSAPFYVVIG